MPLLSTVILATTLFNTLIAGFVLLHPNRSAKHKHGDPPTVTFRRVLFAAIVAFMIGIMELPFLFVFRMHIFGSMQFAFLSIFVMLPLLGLSTIAAAIIGRRPNPGPYVSKSVLLLGVAAVLLAPIGAYARFVEPCWLKVESANMSLPSGRIGKEPIRVGIMTDIQTSCITDYERSAVATLLAQQPDIILLPGDFYQGCAAQFDTALPAYRELLASLHAPGGVYVAPGNIDPPAILERLLYGTSITLLDDKSIQVRVRDRLVTIRGVSFPGTDQKHRSAIRRLESQSGEGDIRILLSHSPDALLNLATPSRIDLVVSGHSHGGQVAIPFFGPPVTFSYVPRFIGAGGLHEFHGNHIYVSRGVGSEGGHAPRIRFLCRPDVSIVTLAN